MHFLKRLSNLVKKLGEMSFPMLFDWEFLSHVLVLPYLFLIDTVQRHFPLIFCKPNGTFLGRIPMKGPISREGNFFTRIGQGVEEV